MLHRPDLLYLKPMLFIFSILLVAGCAGNNNNGMISASNGGSVCAQPGSLIEGACINIPGGALSEDTMVELVAANSVVPTPSLSVAPSAVRVIPDDVSLSNAATLTIPYSPNLLGDLMVNDMVMFSSVADAIGNGNLSVVSAQETVAVNITNFGTFEPGILKADLDNGGVLDIPMEDSRSTVVLNVSPNEQYMFMISAVPSGYDTDPDDVSTDNLSLSILVEDGNSITAKIFDDPTTNDEESGHNNELNERQKFKQRLYNNLKNIIDRGKRNYRERIAKGYSSKTNFKVGDGTDCNVVGDTCDIEMINVSGSGTLTFTATATIETTNGFLLLVDNSDLATIGTKDDALAQALEDNIGIRLNTFFGEPSDSDGNNKTLVAMSNLVTPPVLGFFDATNNFIEDDAAGTGHSNEADIVFSGIPDSNQELLNSTICHEIQHLINFNLKSLVRLVEGTGQVADPNSIPNGTPFSEAHVNEGMSYLAEMLCGYGTISAGPIELMQKYFIDQGSVALIDNSGSVSEAVRGGNYGVLQYIFEQLGGATAGSGAAYTDNGGAAFIKALISSAETGFGNYDTQLRSMDSLARDFHQSIQRLHGNTF